MNNSSSSISVDGEETRRTPNSNVLLSLAGFARLWVFGLFSPTVCTQ